MHLMDYLNFLQNKECRKTNYTLKERNEGIKQARKERQMRDGRKKKVRKERKEKREEKRREEKKREEREKKKERFNEERNTEETNEQTKKDIWMDGWVGNKGNVEGGGTS